VAGWIPTNFDRTAALRLSDVGYADARCARLMTARRVLAGLLLVGSLMATSIAGAKGFEPGDLSVCDASRCVSIRSQSVLNAVASFYYDSARPPARARAPRLGTPFFRLEFSNGYVSGIIAGAALERFLSYGVNLDQFKEGVWYRVPRRAVDGLLRLTVGLTPLRLTVAALTPTGTFAAQGPGATQTSPPGADRVHRAAAGAHGDSARWLLGIAAIAVLIALALLARRWRRSVATQLPTPSAR
jgi:hypothetical protein